MVTDLIVGDGSRTKVKPIVKPPSYLYPALKETFNFRPKKSGKADGSSSNPWLIVSSSIPSSGNKADEEDGVDYQNADHESKTTQILAAMASDGFTDKEYPSMNQRASELVLNEPNRETG